MNKIDIAHQIASDKLTRQKITRENFFWFIHIFLGHHVENELAPFQEEMIAIAQDESYKSIIIMAFRGSGKSTIITLAYALWAILGRQQKKFIVILSNTQAQARNHFANIKQELESNHLLSNDLGPFKADEGLWNSYSLELEQFRAKIISVSREQSIRGMRYREYRPDLIICDDVEDTSPKSEGERENLYNWYMGELMLSGSGENTRYIVLGNLTHENSLLMELRKGILSGVKKDWIFRTYPIADEKGEPLWPKKFTTKKVSAILEGLPGNVGDREYLLKILPEVTIVLDYRDHPHEGVLQNPSLPPRQIPLIEKMNKYDIHCPYIRELGIIKYEKLIMKDKGG